MHFSKVSVGAVAVPVIKIDTTKSGNVLKNRFQVRLRLLNFKRLVNVLHPQLLLKILIKSFKGFFYFFECLIRFRFIFS